VRAFVVRVDDIRNIAKLSGVYLTHLVIVFISLNHFHSSSTSSFFFWPISNVILSFIQWPHW